jgi:hypothetical protein
MFRCQQHSYTFIHLSQNVYNSEAEADKYTNPTSSPSVAKTGRAQRSTGVQNPPPTPTHTLRSQSLAGLALPTPTATLRPQHHKTPVIESWSECGPVMASILQRCFRKRQSPSPPSVSWALGRADTRTRHDTSPSATCRQREPHGRDENEPPPTRHAQLLGRCT